MLMYEMLVVVLRVHVSTYNVLSARNCSEHRQKSVCKQAP